MSGAVVRRSADGRTFSKTVTSAHERGELADERDRLLWLAGTALPVPTVLEWYDDGSATVLSTTAVPGRPASGLSGAAADAAVVTLAALVSTLHGLPVADCPHDRRLDVTLPLAARRAAGGLVDESDLDPERRGRSAADLLAELDRSAVLARVRAEPDLAVCHGDLCLPNVLLTPDGTTVTGVIDVGRLGVADRHQDLALLTRSMSAPGLNPGWGPARAAAFLTVLGVPVDPWRIDFYRLLDELL